MFNLEKKVSIVTGASKGIGFEIAKNFANAGSHVVCVSRTESSLKNVANLILDAGGSASVFPCDVSDLSNFKSLVENTIVNYGSIDILVNNAGITRDALIMRMSEESWDKVIEVNLKGAFNGIKSVSRQMMKQRSGKIINITSIVGLTGNVGQANYAASKAGLIGLSKSASKELASRGINVNCIAPGYINTEMTDQLSAKVKENFNKQIPLGRIGKPEEIASTALFLASEHASYITGQTITVDGGMV